MFCFKCGAEAPDGSTFCQKCGENLNASNITQKTGTANVANQTQQTGSAQSAVHQNKNKKKWLFIVGIIFVIILIWFIANVDRMVEEGAVRQAQDAYVQSVQAEWSKTQTGTTAEAEHSNTETVIVPSETHERVYTIISDKNEKEVNQVYINKIKELSSEYDDIRFSLIDLTEKDELELVIETDYFINIFTWADGQLLPIDRLTRSMIIVIRK